MIVRSKCGTSEGRNKEKNQKNCCVSTGTMNLLPPSSSSQGKSQWWQWPARITPSPSGTWLWKTSKKIHNSPTNWCSFTKGKKKSKKYAIILFITKCWPVAQAMASTFSSRALKCQKKSTIARKISSGLRLEKKISMRFWVGKTEASSNWSVLYLNPMIHCYGFVWSPWQNIILLEYYWLCFKFIINSHSQHWSCLRVPWRLRWPHSDSLIILPDHSWLPSPTWFFSFCCAPGWVHSKLRNQNSFYSVAPFFVFLIRRNCWDSWKCLYQRSSSGGRASMPRWKRPPSKSVSLFEATKCLFRRWSLCSKTFFNLLLL